MARWPFDEFAFNTKCLVFSGTLMAAYMYLPCRYDRNWGLTVAGIGVAAYVAMAWYDYAYQCELKMRRGVTGLVTGPMKPPVGDDGTYGGALA